MNCLEARELLLEASPAELAGEGDSALAGHLHACEECRAVARDLIAATGAMRSAYQAITPSRLPVLHGSRRRAVLLVASLAAAASLAFFVYRPTRVPSAVTPSHPTVVEESRSVTVELSDSTNAIVFGTANPLVDIVWIYQGN